MFDLRAAQSLAAAAAELTGARFGRERPFVLNHLITVRCNLSCPFCYVAGPEQRDYNRRRYPRTAEMATAELRRFYREVVDARFRLAIILGGEPLLRTDLDEVLAELEGHLWTTLFTNGFLLADRHPLLARASQVFVSLDAPDAEHDALRATPGSFERALAGIEAMRSRQPTARIGLNMTVTEHNVGRVDEMIRFARDLGLPVAFQPPSYDGQFAQPDRPNETSRRSTPAAERVSAAFRHIREEAARTDHIIGSRAFFDLVVENRSRYPCHYPGYVLGPVYPNGDVVGCVESQVIANVRESTVSEILAGEAWRSNAAAGPGCDKGCRDWGIHDLSAIREGRFDWNDAARYYQAMSRRAGGDAPSTRLVRLGTQLVRQRLAV